jgi:streptogramin lyase
MQSATRVVTLGAALLLGLAAVAAADQTIAGKKLLIKNPPSGAAGNKIVHLGKDPGIVTGGAGSASDPQCSGAGGGGTSSVRIIASGGAGDATIPLPCGGWTRSGDLYKYKDSSGASCNIVLVKGGTLAKAVCKGPHVAIDVSGSMSPVTVVTTLNIERYCTTFGGSVKKDGSDDKTFLRKDAAAPGSCPSVTTSTSSTTSTTLPPTCCDLGTSVCFNIENQGNVDTCVGVGGTPTTGVCDAATGTCQGSGGGATFCCRDAAPFPCSEGPGTSEEVCISLGGTFADDSCAAGCTPSSTSFGSMGSGDGQFNQPMNVAIDGSGNIFVAEGVNHRIQKFDSNGTFLTKWGTLGGNNGEFDTPTGLAVDGSGNVFVSESCQSNNIFNGNCQSRVQKFTNGGTFLLAWGGMGAGDGQLQNPTGVAVDGSGNVYVADHGNSRIQKFTNTGTFVTKWGSFGNGNGQFSGLYGIAVDGSGNVYTSDWGADRIQKFDSNGTYLAQWGSAGSGDGQLNNPNGLGVDASGNVYVADGLNARIQKFTSTGTYLAQWGSFGSGYGQLAGPNGVAVDASGNIYVADRHNHRITIFAP